MADFVMPSLGAGMEEGILSSWRCAPGERVTRGQVIAEVETEKGLIEVEVWVSGAVAELLVEEGAKVPVGTVLARIDEATGAASVVSPAPATASPTAPSAPSAAFTPTATRKSARATPSARHLAREAGLDPASLRPTGPHGTLIKPDVGRAIARQSRTRVSPYARARARSLGVDLALVAPGPDGVVHAAQVETAPTRPVNAAASMRRAIANAMTRAKREIPHYYLSHTLDLGDAVALLAAANEGRPPADRVVIGALLLAAAARALARVPELNARWTGESAPPLDAVHLGVAIALRGGGLVAPAIHDANTRSAADLMKRLEDLVTRARRGVLRASELSDPTITVTSLGERGVESVLGVIHPPQVAMVGFGRVVERPWVVDGAVVPRPVVTVTLAADHRVSDGHRGGIYLAEIERQLSRPEEL